MCELLLLEGSGSCPGAGLPRLLQGPRPPVLGPDRCLSGLGGVAHVRNEVVSKTARSVLPR